MSAQRHTYERWIFAFDIRCDDTAPARVVARRLLKYIGRSWGIRCMGYSEDAALAELRADNERLQKMIESMAERIAAQSELLARIAERKDDAEPR